MNILTIIILAFIFVLILFVFNKHHYENHRIISLFDSGFGELRVGSIFSFIDETVYPLIIRIGYIKKIDKDGTVLIHTLSLNKTVKTFHTLRHSYASYLIINGV